MMNSVALQLSWKWEAAVKVRQVKRMLTRKKMKISRRQGEGLYTAQLFLFYPCEYSLTRHL